MRRNLYPLVIVLTIMAVNCSAQAHKRATPPTADQVVGTWVGFDGAGSEFIRLELQGNSSGYLAIIAPPDFITHDYGAQVYKIAEWSVNGWQITCDLSPSSSNAEPAQAKGEIVVSSLRLDILGIKRRWKIDSVLFSESQLERSNKETKDAILAFQKK